MVATEPAADEPGSRRRRRGEGGGDDVRERGGESARSGGAGSGWDATSLRLRDGEGNCILHRVLQKPLEALQLSPVLQFADAAAFGEAAGVSLTLRR
jgi:hypothetical protein